MPPKSHIGAIAANTPVRSCEIAKAIARSALQSRPVSGFIHTSLSPKIPGIADWIEAFQSAIMVSLYRFVLLLPVVASVRL
jgi:hypothetical protein